MKVIKKNLIITGYELNKTPSFIKDLEFATKQEWGCWGLKSNHKRHGFLSELYRYFLYYFFSIYILLSCRKCKNIITTQQFYGLIIAFYSRLLHLRKRYSLTVLTFIFKPKKGLIGSLYFRFMKYIVNSKYIDGIVVYSQNEVKYYENLFGCTEGLFHYVRLGKSDESKSHLSEKGDYLISVGRSNRDYGWLISIIAKTEYKLIIVNDSFKGETNSPNVQILSSCYKDEMIDLMAKSFCVIIPLLDPNISAGQLVALQAQNLHKPVIATESEGITNYISNGETGFIIKKDEKALLDALNKLKDEVIYDELSDKGYKSFMKKYSISQQFENIGLIVNEYLI